MLDRVLTGAPQWRDRPGRVVIPMDRWGEDHWGLLVHVESRVVDDHGHIDWNRLSLSRRNWPMLWAARNPYGTTVSKDAADEHGLRLKAPDGSCLTLFGCCEGDALMDLVEAGLVTIEMPQVSSTGQSYLRPDGHALNDPSPSEPVTGRVEWALMPWARFTLTDQGWTLAGAARRHRDNGGKYVSFTPDLVAGS
ncbi:hypothetical protein ACFW2V_12435 [Streptomyces sp. NPDC058947]|uniref:hypothetical protein n=1 Tax=Streptomyces sp. NPDC058947 TaxID=3346675 RepID=UPI0036CA59D4